MKRGGRRLPLILPRSPSCLRGAFFIHEHGLNTE
jgi:hypothetical protein